ncbi:hypothetical protein ENSA5_61960 [Enhygromyxa salina]|uniref:Uncharacterized protein n=1 Tax=Enhygromyxa salina TaxID=215803 RepID=A0A2S9XD26_9BACT|nr:hypothetical protein [Enhygromyxa salina]PRP90762.1 hypothetical protein ENSA5_61960 [Enhygromyxa salina]
MPKSGPECHAVHSTPSSRQLATADFDDTELVNYMGLCGAADASGTVTMWVGEASVSFAPFCPFEGLLAVFEKVWAIESDLAGCQTPFAKLESVEPASRRWPSPT